MEKRKSLGQTMGEYGLAIALIGITGISTLVFFGDTAKNTILAFVSGTAYEQTNTQPLTAQAPSLTAGEETPPFGTSGTDSLQQNTDTLARVSFTLANGQTITLPDYPNNLQQSVETNGTNGTTELLANQLSLITSQLSETDSLDPEQINKLADLANQGHRIANIQGTLSEGIEHNVRSNSPKPLAHLSFNYDQKSIYQGEMADLIGDHVSDGKMSEGLEVRKLKQLLTTAQTSGALADPNLNTVVSTLVADITLIGNQTKASIDEANLQNRIPDNFKTLVAAKLTHQKSGQICQGGGSRDTGISCARIKREAEKK